MIMSITASLPQNYTALPNINTKITEHAENLLEGILVDSSFEDNNGYKVCNHHSSRCYEQEITQLQA